MSLDIYLKIEGLEGHELTGTGIFVRENGSIRELSRAEWDERFPGREPIIAKLSSEDVFDINITHNLNSMARVAGLYQAMWRPEELNIKRAEQLIERLTEGLAKLKAQPDYFKNFNPVNGWGSYEGLVDVVEKYLAACIKWPMATVYVSR